MKRSFQVLAICAAGFGALGCSQQAADSAAEPPTENDVVDPTLETNLGNFARQDLEDPQLPAGLTQDTPPDQIVAAFLGALRSGEDGIGAALLTRRAREETRKRGLTVQRLGSPQAQFEVGVPKYLGALKNGAHVNTTWTETRDDGVIAYDIIWALRRQDFGWRVAGMGAQLGPGQPVEYLNFEDPDDMLAKWREADDAYLAGQQTRDPGVRQAQTPDTSDTLPR